MKSFQHIENLLWAKVISISPDTITDMWIQNFKIINGGIWLPKEELERLRKEQRKLAKEFFDTKHMYWEHKARKEMCDDFLNLIPKEESSVKEETHTLREWQEILVNNPALMAEFESLTPPKPIK